MSHARFNEDDVEVVSHNPDQVAPDRVTQPAGRERPLLSRTLVLLGLVGGVAAATVGAAEAGAPVAPRVSYADDIIICGGAEDPTLSLPALREQFRDAFTQGVVEDPPFHVEDKIGEC